MPERRNVTRGYDYIKEALTALQATKREEPKFRGLEIDPMEIQSALGSGSLSGAQPIPESHPHAGNMEGLDPDLSWLIQKESGGRTTAKNPKSSAFGLGQLIKANRERIGESLGFDPNTTDYNQQLQMMNQYIKERYGSAKAARDFWQRKGWY